MRNHDELLARLDHTDAAKYAEIAIESEYKSHVNLAACYLDSQAKLTAAHAQGDAMEIQLEQCGRVQMQMQAKMEAERDRAALSDRAINGLLEELVTAAATAPWAPSGRCWR